VIAAIEKAVQASRISQRARDQSVAGPSIFESCLQDPLCQAVEAAWKSGIVVVVAGRQ